MCLTTRIQWAVDNATDGDSIIVRDIVRDEIYSESINTNKQSIKSENGSENCIIFYRGIEL